MLFTNIADFCNWCIEIASRAKVTGLNFWARLNFVLDKLVEIGYNVFIKNGIGN